MSRRVGATGMVAAAVLFVLGVNAASADLWQGTDYGFVDQIAVDTWPRLLGWDLDATRITQGSPLAYRHDLTVYGVPDERRVAEAWLELSFVNDLSDYYSMGRIKLLDLREFTTLVFDGSAWKGLDEVDNGAYELAMNVDWLNDNGVLDVKISVSNPLGQATAWLDHSVLYGNFVHMPVPAAVLLGAVGLGYAGMKLRRYA
ncbi:MAG: hypothetical protein KBE65_13200 [Phycisphaerae bacterium]|nr:hypothetical protein [Phycisphaerae bacterium]